LNYLGEYKANMFTMHSAATIRREIETALAQRIPAALTPMPRVIRAVAAAGIPSADELLEGGLPVGAITEIVGPDCSGRTSFALSFLAGITQAAKVCAWVDVSDALNPESAAAAGVDLARLLWVRCGVQRFSLPLAIRERYRTPPIKKSLQESGLDTHPRNETRGLPSAINNLFAPRCAEPQRRVQPEKETIQPVQQRLTANRRRRPAPAMKPWSRIEQALRATDLLLQAGGFSAMVVDMGNLAQEFVSRVPLTTWFRYRAAAERTQSSILLLTQHSCAKSSAELVLRFAPPNPLDEEATVFTGVEHSIEVARRRFTQAANNVVSIRKPPRSVPAASWHSRAAWAGTR
jgi:recombination protein RecA